MSDGYALSSPYEAADDGPGVPCTRCERCGTLRVAACPCDQVGYLSPPLRRVLAKAASPGGTRLGVGEISAATSLVRRGLLRQRGYEPTIYTLTRVGEAIWREVTP